MSFGDIITNLLLLAAGLGVFLFGLSTMSNSLQNSAGSKLKNIFDKLTKSKTRGVLIGTGATAILQSSSAVTVIVVGFVNSGLIGLSQAAPVIMGANIGTTVTAFMMALPFSEFIAALCLVGALLSLFSKNEKVRKIALILVGLGSIFVGLIVMNNSMRPFSDTLRHFFSVTGNPFLLLIIGLVFTALIQSSSAATGILIALASATDANGLPAIGIDSAMFVLIGVNIGTCITVFLASLGTSPNARRTAFVHIIFNVFGAVIIGGLLFINPIRAGAVYALALIPDIKMEIAVFHIVFNVVTAALLLPLSGSITKFTELIIKAKPDKKSVSEFSVKYIGDYMLNAPAIALSQSKKEIILMYNLALENLELAIDAVMNKNLDRLDEFEKRERHINFLNRALPEFLVKISAKEISYTDEVILGTYFHAVSDIERIGDYAENLTEYVAKTVSGTFAFSTDALNEIGDMYGKIKELAEAVCETFATADIAVSSRVESLEASVDLCKQIFHNSHIERLSAGKCTAENGAAFISLISDLERIADHLTNIAHGAYSHKESIGAE